jgi:hypothetical protein
VRRSYTTPTSVEHGLTLRRYSTNVCAGCAIKHRCSVGGERRITRCEHEHVLETVQQRLDGSNFTGCSSGRQPSI